MKKIISLIIFSLILTTTTFVSAQIKTGGYRAIALDDKQAVAAAEFAIRAQSDKDETEISFDSILKAERQTVAGTNFRLCLSVLLANPEDTVEEIFVQTVVSKSLKNEYSLKSWTEVENCGK